MTSKKAAKAKSPKPNPMHRSAWRSMRILRTWTIPALVRTIPGATVYGVTRFVRSLQRHSIVEVVPGQQGGGVEQKRYRIYPKLADQPQPPQVCHLCECPIKVIACEPAGKAVTLANSGEDTETDPQRGTPTQKKRKKKRRLRTDPSTWKEPRRPEVIHDPA